MVNTIRHKANRYISKGIVSLLIVVIMIQKYWKHSSKVDIARKLLLMNYWDKAKDELIEKYTKLRSKHRTILNRLKIISEKTRNSIINKYYWNIKRDYIIVFYQWVKYHKKSRPLTLFGVQAKSTSKVKSLRPLNRVIASAKRRVSSKRVHIIEIKKKEEYPKFHYKPIHEEITGMIMRLVQD